MASVNKAIILGNLGADPELSYTQSGTAKARMRVATEERWTKDGEKKSHTEWHQVIAWGRLAEICGEYLKKGRPVYFEGKIQTRSWDDKDGNKKYTTEIVAFSMQLLGDGGSRQERPTTPEPDDDIPF